MKLQKKRAGASTLAHWYDFFLNRGRNPDASWLKGRRNSDARNSAASVDNGPWELPDKQLLYQMPWPRDQADRDYSRTNNAMRATETLGEEKPTYIQVEQVPAPAQVRQDCARSTWPQGYADHPHGSARPDSPTMPPSRPLYRPPMQNYQAIERIREWNSRVPLPERIGPEALNELAWSNEPAARGLRREHRRIAGVQGEGGLVKAVATLPDGDSVDYSLHTRDPVVEEHIYPEVHTRYHPLRIRTTHVHEHRWVIQPIAG